MNEYKTNNKTIGITIATVLLVIAGIIILMLSAHQVDPSHQGLKISGGKLNQQALEPGFYLLVPFWQRIEDVFTGTVSTDEDTKGEYKEENPFRDIRPLSKDGQVIDIDVQLGYSVTNAITYRERTGSSDPRTIEQLLLIPTIRKLVYDYASEYTWKGLIQEGDRQEFGRRITQAIQSGEVTKRTCTKESKTIDVNTGTEIIIEAGCTVSIVDKISQPNEYGVTVSTVNFKKIEPNQKIISAVEEAQAKEQEVKIAAQKAEIAKQVANEAIEKKRGETESQKLEAGADAFRLRIVKEEEAKGVMALAAAEKARAQALAQSQQLVEYKKLEIEMKKADALVEFGKNWKGSVPATMTIIGTDEAKDMNLFYGMAGIVANPAN